MKNCFPFSVTVCGPVKRIVPWGKCTVLWNLVVDSKRKRCYGGMSRHLLGDTKKDYRHKVHLPDTGLRASNGRLGNHPHPISLSDTFQSSVDREKERERNRKKIKSQIEMEL